MSEPEIPLPSIAKLDLRDKDILIIRLGGRITPQGRESLVDRLKEMMDKAGKPGVQVLILEDGAELQVLRPT